MPSDSSESRAFPDSNLARHRVRLRGEVGSIPAPGAMEIFEMITELAPYLAGGAAVFSAPRVLRWRNDLRRRRGDQLVLAFLHTGGRSDRHDIAIACEGRSFGQVDASLARLCASGSAQRDMDDGVPKFTITESSEALID